MENIQILTRANTRTELRTYEQELVADILSLMASFSAKIYGKRSSENRKKKNK